MYRGMLKKGKEPPGQNGATLRARKRQQAPAPAKLGEQNRGVPARGGGPDGAPDVANSSALALSNAEDAFGGNLSAAAVWFAEHQRRTHHSHQPLSAPTKLGQPGARARSDRQARKPQHRQGDPLDRDAITPSAGAPASQPADRPGLDRIRTRPPPAGSLEPSCRNAPLPARQCRIRGFQRYEQLAGCRSGAPATRKTPRFGRHDRQLHGPVRWGAQASKPETASWSAAVDR